METIPIRPTTNQLLCRGLFARSDASTARSFLQCLYRISNASPLCLYRISIVSLIVSSFYELYKLYELNKPDLSLLHLQSPRRKRAIPIFPNYGRCDIIGATGRRSGKARAEFPPNKLTQQRVPGNNLRRPSSKKRNDNG
jgi:hypothetical protein